MKECPFSSRNKCYIWDDYQIAPESVHCIGGSHALKRRAVCSVWSVFTGFMIYYI